MRFWFFVSILILSTPISVCSQTGPGVQSNNSFMELNLGVAYLPEGNSLSGSSTVFPGLSFLWGKTIMKENNLIIEYSAGFALPTLVTGKFGIGKKFGVTKIIMGVRPYPFNIFLETSFITRTKGYWITSIEFNPLKSSSTLLSFDSKAILNFGYRWNLATKRNIKVN